MKFIFTIWLISINLWATPLSWGHNYNKTVVAAQQHNKMIFLMYASSWCPECNYMKEIIFNDPKINAYMQNHFELLSLDIQKDTIPKAFPYVGIPTYYIINPFDNTVVKKIEGGSKASVFLQKLQK